MGCDIHLYVETRKDETTPWQWLKMMPPRECSWCAGKGHYEGRPKEACYMCKGVGANTKPFHERSYNTFAILANVRNGRGFAGVKTGEGFNFISEPRGLPKDLSAGLKKAACIEAIAEDGSPVEASDMTDDEREAAFDEDNYDGTGTYRPSFGDHSFTHLSMHEVMNFDWDQQTSERGLVSLPVYLDWVEVKGRKGRPEEWCGDIGGHGIRHVEPKEVDKLIAEGKVDIKTGKVKDSGETLFVDISWAMGYREAVNPDFWRFLESLLTLNIEPSNIRFVFGFDS